MNHSIPYHGANHESKSQGSKNRIEISVSAQARASSLAVRELRSRHRLQGCSVDQTVDTEIAVEGEN